MQYWLIVLMFTVFMGSALYAEGDEGYIYGKITLQNGNTYQGVIRWGDEEAFWDDMFNATQYDDVFDSMISVSGMSNPLMVTGKAGGAAVFGILIFGMTTNSFTRLSADLEIFKN